MTLSKHPKHSILALYQSDREITVYNRFVGPLIRLANKCHKVQVISTGINDRTGSLICHKVKDVSFPVLPSLPFLIQSLIASLLIAKKRNLNLFLCYREEDLLVGWLVKKIKGVRLVYYAHGDSITIQQLVSRSIVNNFRVSLLKMLEKMFLPKVDLTIAVSQDTRSKFLNRSSVDPDKIVVVYNNILSGNSDSTQLSKKSKEEGKRLIGYVGHFSCLKGVETLLSAFSILSEHINDIILILVGDGPIKRHLRDLTTQMELQDKVIFTGWVKNPRNYMRDFDVLVVPSLYEGCPSVILEAFSLDVPVLGSRAGGIPELLGSADLMFQPSNPGELALKLEKLFASDEKVIQAKRLVEDRKKKFTFDHTSIVEQLFLQLFKTADETSKI